ncbi:MAG: Holliday junction branch migration protein RuvA [Clostridia bacterium]|nr:Holliday junction branch migration protein RuvA [Clostridia bacterium]
MYAYLKGKVADVCENVLVLDVNGVGYELNVSAYTLNTAKIGEEKVYYTFLVVKEDEMSLYAFADKREKTVFMRLISISGVGPKLALAILSGMKYEDLVSNIVSGNTSAVNSIKGVGKKTAERIVLELGDKFDDMSITAISEKKAPISLSGKAEEAVATLVALGFNRDNAIKSVNLVYSEDLTVSQIIHKAINV